MLTAALVVAVMTFEPTPSGPPQPAAGHSADGTADTADQPAAPPLPASDPLRVSIPELRVDAPLTDLALEDDSRLAAPPETDAGLAGWWADGPTPGTRGTAIIAGHVDVPTGPAVFYDLGALDPGATVRVGREDGSTAHFTVDDVEVYDADDFPDDKVYADTGRPELRVITCGGGFDEQLGQYRGNVVVTAHLTDE
ncbi:class F sortase [Streptomyces sp. YIM 130001]|uniref:class F sortase n=1 Tax=Streptomyces sp. YIM 130001 TaxID=2259644 RepID=UPI001F094E13|nr:class F sortase [Streptomyces sp. YIM 130001]